MRLHTKFVLFTNLAAWLTGIGVLVATAFICGDSLRDILTQSHEMEAVKWQAVCFESVVEKNPRLMAKYAQVLELQPGVRYAYFAGRDGVVASRSDARGKPGWSAGAAPSDADAWEISRPVMVDDREVGRATVGFSRKFEARLLSRTLLIALIKVLLVALLMTVATILASGLFADRLARRLKTLRAAAVEIEKGNFAVRIPPSSDELSFFSSYFNRMAERLASLDQLKDDFISSVSHDLKNPLALVHMWIDYALHLDPANAHLTPAQRELLVKISDVLARHRVYISNILNAAKIKTGQVSYHLQPVPVEPVLRQAKATHDMLAEKKQVALELDIAADLPPVQADSEGLEHAIANLVSNALKFTPRGGKITLSARENGDRIDVSVADTGFGISAEDLPNLFQRFRQFGVAEQREKKIKGTGLGLYIVKQNVEGMGGRVTVESKLDQGTRFTLSLPKAA